MWSKRHRDEHPLVGARRRYYWSGLRWTGLTLVQQDALTATLGILTGAQAASSPEQLSAPPRAGREGGAQEGARGQAGAAGRLADQTDSMPQDR